MNYFRAARIIEAVNDTKNNAKRVENPLKG